MNLTRGERALVDELIAVGADAVRTGLVLASGGNLSAREPGSDRFVITRSGTWFDRLRPDDFAAVDLGGRVLDGEHPSSEWRLHRAVYAARPDANCVVHLHPQYAVLVDALGYPIRALTLDDALYVGPVGLAPYHPNGSDALADAAASAARTHDCVVLSHHGCSVAADTVDMAYRRAQLLERAAHNTYLALALGDTDTTFPAGVELTHE